MADPTEFQIAHTAWTAVLTLAGGVVAFFTKRLVDDVDQKADQCDVDELKKDMRNFMEQQQRQHEGNTARLDMIIDRLGNRGSR